MRPKRKILILTAVVAGVAALSAWIGIKIGRPLYYSDGQKAVAASDIQESGMLRWTRPEAQFEIPGEVRGRVTELPDGRVIYGQPAGDGSTNLVTFDPASSSREPRPCIELNSKGHDLAPVLGLSGRLFFASDRASGAGGFDIYSAAYRDGIFFAVRRLSDGINTGLDESDPAIDKVGGQLVFVRRDQDIDRGRNGRLMIAPLDDPESVKPVFARNTAGNGRRVSLAPIDRDPTFAPDGLGIYFVRERFGELPQLMRTFWHRDRYVDPMLVPALQVGGPFRGPTIVNDGFGIQLASIGSPVVVYHAQAEEVYPYLAGRWWLEWLLLSSVGFFGLLVVLLVLGARWSHLDIVTKLLLLSMLIHLILLLWVSRMEIIRSFEPTRPGTGKVEVHLIAKSANQGETGSTEIRQDVVDVSRSVQFEGHEEAITGESPGTKLEQLRSDLDARELERPTYGPIDRAQDATLSDRAEQVAVRAAEAEKLEHQRRQLQTSADTANRAEVSVREHVAEKIKADAPQAQATLAAELLAGRMQQQPMPQVVRPKPLARQQKARNVAMGDAPVPLQVRAGRANPATAVRVNEQANRALYAVNQPLARLALTAPNEGLIMPIPRARPVDKSIASAPSRRDLVQPSVTSALQPRAVAVREQLVRDSVDSEVTRAVAKSATTKRDASLSNSLQPAKQGFASSAAVRAKSVAEVTEAMAAPRPRSDLELEKARRNIASRRQLPSQRQVFEQSMVTLSDGPVMVSDAMPVATKRAVTPAVTASKLDAVRRQEKGQDLQRDSTSIAMGRPTDIKPDSMFARHDRNLAIGSGANAAIPRSRDFATAVVALEDSVAVQDTTDLETKPTPKPLVDRSLRALLTRVRPNFEVVGIERLQRSEVDPGILDHDFGVEIPGSFLARSKRAEAVPVATIITAKLTPYANRFGANKQAALKKYGGDAATERAVQKGLEYLASIQNKDGTWGNHGRTQEKYGQVFVGKTGLCLLAFLGAGHTPTSATQYSDVSRRAVTALLGTQIRDTHFGRSSSYSHGITTYALAECYALTQDKNIRGPLENAVGWILENQNLGRDRRNRGGWGYFSPTLSPEDQFSRSSASAWQIMALESAKLSGLEVPDEAMNASREFLLNSYDRRYRYFLYTRDPERLESEWRTLPASTPASVFCLQLFGMDPAKDKRLADGISYTLARAPRRYRKYSDDDFVLRGAGNVYFWYYGSLACFMAGGETWDRWNTALKRVLIEGQSEDGSFRPIDSYAASAGDTQRDRSYTTSMCVLSLEVYYRYFTPLLKHK
jgi:hypothetical protein